MQDAARTDRVQDRAAVESLGRPALRVVRGDADDVRTGEQAEPDVASLLLLELAEVDDQREAREGAALVRRVERECTYGRSSILAVVVVMMPTAL